MGNFARKKRLLDNLTAAIFSSQEKTNYIFTLNQNPTLTLVNVHYVVPTLGIGFMLGLG